MSTTLILRKVLCLCAVATVCASGVTYVPEGSNRVKINLGETAWKFKRGDFYPDASKTAYDDASWKDVGIPHCFNETDTYINTQNGFDNGSYRGTGWYRKHFVINEAYRGKKIFVEFEGAHIAAAVYINGQFLKGNHSVKQPGDVTKVHGFIGFVVDISDYVKFGAEENVLAVRVSNKTDAGWFENPQIGTRFNFSMGMGGIFRPVWLHITDPVHVPLNLYSVLNTWGTYVATLTADAGSAKIRIQTNVQNETTASRDVSLTVKVTDANNNVVLSMDSRPGPSRIQPCGIPVPAPMAAPTSIMSIISSKLPEKRSMCSRAPWESGPLPGIKTSPILTARSTHCGDLGAATNILRWEWLFPPNSTGAT
jgi:beta-galactosidase